MSKKTTAHFLLAMMLVLALTISTGASVLALSSRKPAVMSGAMP